MRNRIILKNATIVLPTKVIRNGVMEIFDGRIVDISSDNLAGSNVAEVVDLEGNYLFPGFIDLHVHGGGGGSFNSLDGSAHEKARQYHLYHGTTSMLATTSTTEIKLLEEILISLSSSAGTPSKGSRVIGIHTEGPFISPHKNGAHHIPLILKGSVTVMDRLIEASKSTIKMVTIAPEIEGGMELISNLISRNIVVSLGHSDATYDETQIGIAKGAKSSTHSFNAMSPLNHREPGMVGAILDSSEIFCEVILDGVHLHPAAFRILLACKGPNKINLITDATAYAGEPDGTYSRSDGRGIVKVGNKMTIENSNTLAGSSLNMNLALINCRKFADVDLPELSKLASLNAARIHGIEKEFGSLEVGKVADIVILDKNLVTCGVIMEGVWKRNYLK